MESGFIDRHLLNNEQIAQLLKRWEQRDLKPRPYKKSSRSWEDYKVQWRPATPNNPAITKANTIELEEGRDVMLKSMEYYYDDTDLGGLLLLSQAGMGKSTTAIRIAQMVAKAGGRVAYFMPRHSYYDDIMENPFTEPHLWWHWKSTAAYDEESGESMCRLNEHATKYMRKGYRLIDMCKSLCLDNGHMAKCAYRKQARIDTPIVAVVHQHAAYGIGITNFDLAIIDENFIGSFVGERFIHVRDIDNDGKGHLGSILSTLRKLALNAGDEKIARYDLMKHIAKDLRFVLNSLDGEDIELQDNTVLRDVEQVERMKEWYLPELITLLIPELLAYEAGMKDWLSRVYIDKKGLHLMTKKAPWVNMPAKVIVLDATGRADLYENLLGMDFTTVEPNVRMEGRIFQVATSLNSISQVVKPAVRGEENRELTWRGRELLAACQYIASRYNRTGVVTYKALRWAFEMEFGEENVMHFGGSRGSNLFMQGEKPVDAVIVAGSPAPPDDDIYQLASQILFDPMDPERSKISLNGGRPISTARSSEHIEYPYVRDDGMAPFRLLGGFWTVDELRNVLAMFREDEIRQSLHRGRPLIQPCDVWLMTTVPTTEPLTGFYENLDQPFATELNGMKWQNWLRVHLVIVNLSPGTYTLEDLTNLLGTKFSFARKWVANYAAHKENLEWSSDVLTVI